VITLADAVRTTVAAGVPLNVALMAATRNPADAVGRPDIGRLGTGNRADVVAFDRDLRVMEVWVGGERSPKG